MAHDLKNSLFRFYLKQFFPSGFSTELSLKTQRRIFKNILSGVSGTLLGRDLKLSAVNSYEDFAKSVPLTDYGFYETYVDKIKAGQQHVMTRHKVIYFGKSAGTSGKNKLIPVTRQYTRHCHVRGTFFGLSRIHSFSPDVDVLSHKNFVMTGGVYETLAPSEITVADISAIMMRNVPLPFRTIYVPRNALVTHSSWEHKLNTVPGEVKNADIGSIIGIPTWHLTVLNKIRDEIPFEHLCDLWKNLRYFFHGGVNFEPYRNYFKELFGRNDFMFYEIYNATEGYFGVQAYPDGGDLLLLTDVSVFYEFIAFSNYGSTDARAIPLQQVKTGIPYALVITTMDGLLRYVIGDVITFTGIDPFTFRVTGRTQEYINAFGEDLLLSNVVDAFSQTNQKFGCAIRDYTVAPQYIELSTKGRIQFLIEFIKPPSDLKTYSLELDEALKLQNSNYAQKRNNDLALNPLEVIPAAEGAFYKWMEQKGKLGGQNKIPRLVNNRSVIEEILAFNQD